MNKQDGDITRITRDDLSLWSFFVQGIREWTALSVASLCGIPLSKTPVRRLLWLTAVLPGSFVLLLVHWLCFWLDDFLFPGARSTTIDKPVFVLGPPRCGTTHLHRALALDTEGFVTPPAWEVFLAPTVIQKKFLRFLLKMDRAIGSPLRRLVRRMEKTFGSGFNRTHPGSLADPEEDYFYLLPVMACSGIALAFPDWKGFRKLVPGLKQDSPDLRKRALHFYRFCLRKQLYAGRKNARLLSKNASFSSWMDILPGFFPDAQWISCMRDPAKAVPSMISTAETAMQDFFLEGREPEGRDWLTSSMEAHYQRTAEMATCLPSSSFQIVAQEDLREHLDGVLNSLSDTFGWNPGDAVRQQWRDKAKASRSFTSTHHYSSTPDLAADISRKESFPRSPATVLHPLPETAQ